MLTLDQAKLLLNDNVKDPILRMHCREVEVVMRGLAKEIGQNENDWGVVGLLHDLDFEREKTTPERHGITTGAIIKAIDTSFPEEYLFAIKSHNESHTGCLRQNPIDFALMAADNLAGIVFATALVYPDKKISSVKASSVLKKMKTPSFAAKINREAIGDITKIKISVKRAVEIAINEMAKIQTELGL